MPVTKEYDSYKINSMKELADLLKSLPENTRIVSDVGVSMFGGWGDLKSANFYSGDNILELVFE